MRSEPKKSYRTQVNNVADLKEKIMQGFIGGPCWYIMTIDTLLSADTKCIMVKYSHTEM
jgi:hypothetical protein